jgi:hypothetical protein
MFAVTYTWKVATGWFARRRPEVRNSIGTASTHHCFGVDIVLYKKKNLFVMTMILTMTMTMSTATMINL